MKILVIGATHAGTFATQQILTDHPDAEVTVYERNNNLSFLSCGIALWVGDHVSDPDKMFYSSPEALAKLGANMQMEHDVLNIDPATKTVEVKDLKTGTVTTDTYDKLVYTTGSTPIIPNIPGIHDSNVYLCKNWSDAKTLKDLAPSIKSAIVIGAGYIGAELAEQFALTDKEVTLIDGLPRVWRKTLTPLSRIALKSFTPITGFTWHSMRWLPSSHKLIRVSRLQPIKATIPRILQFYVPASVRTRIC